MLSANEKSVAESLGIVVAGGIGSIVVLAIVCAVTVMSWTINGFVGMHLWQWFAVETFGVRTIHLWGFVGLSILIGWLRHGVASTQIKGWRDIFGILFVQPAIVLLCGYIVHKFILHYGI